MTSTPSSAWWLDGGGVGGFVPRCGRNAVTSVCVCRVVCLC